MKRLFFLAIFALSLTGCKASDENNTSTALNPAALQQVVDSLAQATLVREGLLNCYAIILQGDGCCVAVAKTDSIVSDKKIYPGSLWSIVSAALLMERFGFTPSMAIPDRGYVPGWPGKLGRSTSDSISIKDGLQRGDPYTICFLSYLGYVLEDPAITLYREYSCLFDADLELSAEQSYPQCLVNLYRSVTGTTMRVSPGNIAAAFHALYTGGTSRQPYLREPGETIRLCSRQVSDSLKSILIDTAYCITPVCKRSSSIDYIDEDSQTLISQRCFVGSFTLGGPVTIFCYVAQSQYPADSKESFPRPSPAEKLFREITEFMIETKTKP